MTAVAHLYYDDDGDNHTQLNLRVSETLNDHVERAAIRVGWSRSKLLRRFIEAWLNSYVEAVLKRKEQDATEKRNP